MPLQDKPSSPGRNSLLVDRLRRLSRSLLPWKPGPRGGDAQPSDRAGAGGADTEPPDEDGSWSGGDRPTAPADCAIEWTHGGYARITVVTDEVDLEIRPMCDRLREVAPTIGSFYALSGRIEAIAASLGYWAEVSTNPDPGGDWVILVRVRRPFGPERASK